MIVNGVTLPDIPADILAKYPNALILWSPQEVGSDGYWLLLAKGEIGYVPGSLFGSTSNYLMSTEPGFAKYLVAYPNNATEWVSQGEADDVIMQFEVLSGFTPVWANLDIYEITSVDMNTGAYTKGDIWFPNSETPETEYAERYSVLGSILVGTARQIMRLTDSTKKVKPEEFEAKLESVEKGGGGTGGEGGDDISYPSASGTTFGTESVVTEKETGNTKYGDETLQTVPNDNAYAYTIITTNSDKSVYWADHYAAPLSLTLISGNKHYFYLDEKSAFVSYKCEGNNGWKKVSSGSKNAGTTVSYSNVLWASFPFVKNGETVQEFPEAVPEMETTIEERPVEREDSYIIGSDDLNAMISAAQKITGSVDTMTPGEAAEALEEYYASLNTETTE